MSVFLSHISAYAGMLITVNGGNDAFSNKAVFYEEISRIRSVFPKWARYNPN